MTTNKLKLKDSKTEFMMLFSSHTNNTLPGVTVNIGNDTIGTSISARNLGVIWDSSLNMLPHINRVIQLSFVQLKNIRAIKSSITNDALDKDIYSFITSILDYGLPANAIKRLQRIQNSAVRVLSGITGTALSGFASYLTDMSQHYHCHSHMDDNKQTQAKRHQQ